MILSETKIAEMAGALRVVFGCDDQALIDEVVTVLAWGNANRPNVQENTLAHLEHARSHILDRIGFDEEPQYDEETGCSHRSHAIARMLLALYCEFKRS